MFIILFLLLTCFNETNTAKLLENHKDYNNIIFYKQTYKKHTNFKLDKIIDYNNMLLLILYMFFLLQLHVNQYQN